MLLTLCTVIAMAQLRKARSSDDRADYFTMWLAQESFGYEIFVYLLPAHASHRQRWVVGTSWCTFFMVSGVLASVVHALHPSAVTMKDEQAGITHPWFVCYLEMLDAVAIIPQFVRLRQIMEGKEKAALERTKQLPGALLDWIAWLALSRLCAVLDSIPGLYRRCSAQDGTCGDEIFYLFGNTTNLIILSDFFYHYLRGRLSSGLVLPA
eukprot:gnl/MRDRNA2_/MRDRNA2_68471_c0_seq2.p1 gnl/MRDRNA2_/MRDRNA2_68471_c0~~gnl/MRDRNA2_/MRDRNA2_68471_c0_seq2.p1  ORF type:complete len:209 (+),score=25.10 gnl/MRDRNA2_/MRDRNA2_68471_c0_seq2:59-685(+)